MAWHDDLEDLKARHEAAVIVREFAGRDIDIGGVATEGGGVAFMYAEGQFLAREQYLDDIQAVLGDRARAVRVRASHTERRPSQGSSSQREMAAGLLKVTIRLLEVMAEMPKATPDLLRVMVGQLKVSNLRCSNFSTKSTRHTARESRRLIMW